MHVKPGPRSLALKVRPVPTPRTQAGRKLTLTDRYPQACRSTPRVDTDAADLPLDMESGAAAPVHRPFVGELQYLVAYCTGCDPSAATPEPEADLRGPAGADGADACSGEGYCSCDRFARWICHPCHQAEKRGYLQYKRRHFSPPTCKPVGGGGNNGNGLDANTDGNGAGIADDAMYQPLVTLRGSYISMVSRPLPPPDCHSSSSDPALGSVQRVQFRSETSDERRIDPRLHTEKHLLTALARCSAPADNRHIACRTSGVSSVARSTGRRSTRSRTARCGGGCGTAATRSGSRPGAPDYVLLQHEIPRPLLYETKKKTKT